MPWQSGDSVNCAGGTEPHIVLAPVDAPFPSRPGSSLGARPGLEDDQWKLGVERAGDHFIGGARDQAGTFGRQLAHFQIWPSRRPFCVIRSPPIPAAIGTKRIDRHAPLIRTLRFA